MRKRWVLLFAILVAGAWTLFWPGTGRQTVELAVEPGMSARDVYRQLHEKGVLHWRVPFAFWVKVRGISSKIKTGRYEIGVGRSAYWVVDDLARARIEQARVVIPEGFASWQIAERLEEARVCDAEAFKRVVADKNLEGEMFPATYVLGLAQDPAVVAQLFVDELDKRWTPELDARAKELGWTRRDALTLASILEREVRVKEELPLVSAVYHNRLRRHMMLQADPTVQYALGFWKARLTYDDYRNVKSPYNTYLNYGLPPGPICSPGLDAIKAALWPAHTDALYFLANGDGRSTFSKDYRTHTNKVNRRNRQLGNGRR